MGVEAARPYLEETWELLETRMWDAEKGLYAEEADADWNVSPYRSESGNLHVTEALIAAYEATREPKYLERAALVADHVCNRQAGLTQGLVWEHFREDWSADLAFANDADALTIFRPWGFQPGHQVEWARFLLALDRHAPKMWYLPKARFGARMGNATMVDGVAHDGLWDPYGNSHMGVLAELWKRRGLMHLVDSCDHPAKH